MKSLLMQEMTALLGVSRRFGTSWRPWEQGTVESEHREDQVLLALLIEEVFHCFPEEWSRLLPCRVAWASVDWAVWDKDSFRAADMGLSEPWLANVLADAGARHCGGVRKDAGGV